MRRRDCDVTIIGAGIIGLAIASALSEGRKKIFVLEKNDTFGRGISSRNSEVMHAGIYYPRNSLKAALCVEGRAMLSEVCARNGIPHRNTGKLIIAVNDAETLQLERLLDNGRQNGLTSLSLLNRKSLKKLEPHVRALAGLHSPDTGILSAHHLMGYYVEQAKSRGAEIVFRTTVTDIEKLSQGYRITTVDAEGVLFDYLSERVVNAAGLQADAIAGMLGTLYEQHYCKGDYFSINNVSRGMVQRLIYPVPETTGAGLGIHLTLDLNGRMKLGPDTSYITRKENYHVNAAKGAAFFEAAARYLPFIRQEDIVPDMAGIRPKLQAPGEGFRDFVITEDLPGFLNLVGIESPGLTAAPAIARRVKNILQAKSGVAA